MRSWLLAFRPKTLTAALVPIMVATALVYYDKMALRWWISAYALLSATFIQIATNLINDALDFKKGADTAERLGPTRVTQSGLIHAKTVMLAGVACLMAAALFGVPLLFAGGWPILAIGLVSLFLGYAYTGGPFPLAYLGLGDVFVILFFGVIAVGGVYLLQTGVWSFGATVAGLQVGLLATVLLAINNLRDHEGDRKVHKKTLAVRFGVAFARFEIALCALLPFLLMLYWPKMYLPLLSLPLAIVLVRRIYQTAPGPRYNQFLGMAALLHLSFGILLSWALLRAGL